MNTLEVARNVLSGVHCLGAYHGYSMHSMDIQQNSEIDPIKLAEKGQNTYTYVYICQYLYFVWCRKVPLQAFLVMHTLYVAGGSFMYRNN